MSAFEFWNQLVTGGWSCLEKWCANRQPETLHLEFKPAWMKDGDVATANLGELAMASSGFGNIDGGVIVFGVKTVPGPGKADVLDDLTGVRPLADYAERMRSRLKAITSPAIGGIDLRVFSPTQDSDLGVVAVYVPQNQAGPYRAEGPEKLVSGRYYMRQTTDTILASHQVLAAMFGRRPLPALRVGLEFQKDSPHQILVHVLNDGQGAAQGTFVRLKVHRGQNPDSISARGSWRDRRLDVVGSGWDMAFAHPPDELLFPGESRVAGTYRQTADERPIKVRVDCANGLPVVLEQTVTLQPGMLTWLDPETP